MLLGLMDEYTPEMLAMLERQREHFASDDHVRREVEVWKDSKPEERLAELAEMCAAGDFFLSRWIRDSSSACFGRSRSPRIRSRS